MPDPLSIISGVTTLVAAAWAVGVELKKFHDGPRKQLRLNMAEATLAGCRVRIQAYRDGLQLSLNTIILCHQMTLQKSTDQLLPSLDSLHQEIRRLATNMNQQVEVLQEAVQSKQTLADLVVINNLRDCVRSAATIVSSASTTIASQDPDEQKSIIPRSDFGDLFPSHKSAAVQQWIQYRALDGYEGTDSRVAPQSVADVPAIYESEETSDTDSDLENEISELLLKKGKQQFADGDLTGAEKMFRLCLRRLPERHSSLSNSVKHSQKAMDVLDRLFKLYEMHGRLEDAQSMLTRRMSIKARMKGKANAEYLDDVLRLARLMYAKQELVEARLHARRALRGFKKLQQADCTKSCLALLINLCDSENNDGDREAYAIMFEQLETTNLGPDEPARQDVVASGPSRILLAHQSPSDTLPSATPRQSHSMLPYLPDIESAAHTAGKMVRGPENKTDSLEAVESGESADIKGMVDRPLNLSDSVDELGPTDADFDALESATELMAESISTPHRDEHRPAPLSETCESTDKCEDRPCAVTNNELISEREPDQDAPQTESHVLVGDQQVGLGVQPAVPGTHQHRERIDTPLQAGTEDQILESMTGEGRNLSGEIQKDHKDKNTIPEEIRTPNVIAEDWRDLQVKYNVVAKYLSSGGQGSAQAAGLTNTDGKFAPALDATNLARRRRGLTWLTQEGKQPALACSQMPELKKRYHHRSLQTHMEALE